MRHPLFIAAAKNAFDEERVSRRYNRENKIEYFFYLVTTILILHMRIYLFSSNNSMYIVLTDDGRVQR